MASAKLSAPQKNFFILVQEQTAIKRYDMPFLSKTKKVAARGSLWCTRLEYKDKDIARIFSIDDKGVSLVCEPKYIRLLSYTEFQLLLAILNAEERYVLYHDGRDKLSKAVDIFESYTRGKLGTVRVKINCKNTNRYILGTLVQIGPKEGEAGIWFKIRSEKVVLLL